MDIETVLSHVDHTLLKPDATREEIETLCREAVQYRCASVCVQPCRVALAKELLGGAVPVCTVVGFPLGACATETKVFEARKAVEDGADEIDMVINVGLLKDRRLEEVEAESRAVREAVGDRVLKVIVETCLLTEEEKVRVCGIVTKSGADFIKTSTGFSTAGATFEDVKLFKENVGENVRIKAAGGIGSIADAEKFIELGASRLGTSRIVKIVKEQGL